MPVHGVVNELIGKFFPEIEAQDHVWRAEIIVDRMHMGHFDSAIVDAGQHISGRLRLMGFSAFRSRWAYVRQLLSLQGRLLVEQIMWAMGPPWRTLLTGFNPIELGEVGIVVPFREPPEEGPLNVISGPPGGGGGLLPLPPGGGGGGGGGPGKAPKAVVTGFKRRRKRRWKGHWRRR